MYPQPLAQKRHALIVMSPYPQSVMVNTYSQSSVRSPRRFSGLMQSWFPSIHQKTFQETNYGAIESAVRRTMVRA